MVLEQHKHGVGILTTRQEAESALNELRDSGFSLEKVGVMTKDSDCDGQVGNSQRSDRLAAQAQRGATTGAVTGTGRKGRSSLGLLVGFGTLAIAGVGTAIEAGTGRTSLATILGGKAIGGFDDSWVGALAGLGIPEERTHAYTERVRRGDYLVMVQGKDQELANAESILRKRGIQDWEIFNAPHTDGDRTAHAPIEESDRTDDVTIEATERQISSQNLHSQSHIEV